MYIIYLAISLLSCCCICGVGYKFPSFPLLPCKNIKPLLVPFIIHCKFGRLNNTLLRERGYNNTNIQPINQTPTNETTAPKETKTIFIPEIPDIPIWDSGEIPW